MGDVSKSIRHDRVAVRLYHAVDDLAGQAVSNSNLGCSYQVLGVLDGALYHYEIGLKAYERIGNFGDALYVHNNIAELLLALGRIEEAMTHLEKVVTAYHSGTGVTAVAGLAEVNISRCYLRRSDFDAAERHLRRGLRLLRRVGAEGLLTDARLQLGELRLAQGRHEGARQQCRRALARACALEAGLLQIRGERLLGSAEAALGRTDTGRARLRASVALARRIGAQYEEALSLIALGSFLIDCGPAECRAARRSLERAIALLSRMAAETDLAEAQRLLAKATPGGHGAR